MKLSVAFAGTLSVTPTLPEQGYVFRPSADGMVLVAFVITAFFTLFNIASIGLVLNLVGAKTTTTFWTVGLIMALLTRPASSSQIGWLEPSSRLLEVRNSKLYRRSQRYLTSHRCCNPFNRLHPPGIKSRRYPSLSFVCGFRFGMRCGKWCCKCNCLLSS